MPGLIVFKRRWSVGSDDLIIPGLFLFTVHFIWLIILSIILMIFEYDRSIRCIEFLWYYIIAYICVLAVTSIIEFCICVISMRGSILDTSPRVSMQYWIYLKIIVLLVDISGLVVGVLWFKHFYTTCPIAEPKEIVLSAIICNWIVIFSTIITIWCTFDKAGRSWVKMKKYQRSMRESESRFNYKRSGSRSRNWRQRKVIRAYQDSWNNRCKILFCCMSGSERSRNSFTDIARLLSDFFRDLDVVPSDVVAGLVLLRKFQKLEREAIVRQKKNGTHRFLSGVPISENTHFLALNDSRDFDHFQLVIHYMHYALSAYGWPMYLVTHSKTGVCQLCPKLKCCLMCCGRKSASEIIEDNCCFCNYGAITTTMAQIGDVEIIYATFHVDIGETPFFVAIDYEKEKVVISIRGTLSMKDVLTDLNAEGECLPLTPPREDWLGHKGMVQAAVYIKNKLAEENLIERALNHNPSRNTQNFGLVFLGHSLGAGTAAILAILMKQEYSDLQCFSYSPPGGLLSMPAVEYSKSFITSVVVGKDVVPRIGLHQMEALRADLINAIQRSVDPKWKTIACSMICCCCGPEPSSVTDMASTDSNINAYNQQKVTTRNSSHHPSDTHITLTLHRPLYPPGRIIHVLRRHSKSEEQILNTNEPYIYQAIWAESTDFDEVLISPVMLQDHMPDKVLAALEKCVTHIGPRKPQRQTSCANSSFATSEIIDPTQLLQTNEQLQTPQSRVCLETSFTNLQSPTKTIAIENSNNLVSKEIVKQEHPNVGKLKTVAFSRNGSNYQSRKYKPTTLSLCETRPNPFGRKIDLIYDDWFGLAPLASPENLSEVSSISSRASIALNMNLTSSIERCLNKMEAANKNSTYSTVTTPSTVPETREPGEIFESQLHTPKVMRRTPKFSDNLANVNEADNLAYKRMGQVFITHPCLLKQFSSESNSTSSNDEGSYETAQSFTKSTFCTNDNKSVLRNLPDGTSKSADNIDANEKFNQNNKFTSSDTAVQFNCKSGCPICPCTKLPSDPCCQKSDHINCILNLAQQKHGKYSITNTNSSSDTYCSAMSSLTGSDLQQNNKFSTSRLRTYEEETFEGVCNNFNSTTISSITRTGILESHFPVYLDSGDEKSSLLSVHESPHLKSSAKTVRYTQSCNIKPQRKESTSADPDQDYFGFSRNESLPLLSNLVDKSSPNNFVKRKKAIYPVNTSPYYNPTNSSSSPTSFTNLNMNRNESSV